MKDQKGITLIALVITIIVLLILAGVAIAMLSGDNGILKRASESSIETAMATAREQVALEANNAIIEYSKATYVDNNTTKNVQTYVNDALKSTTFKAEVEKGAVTYTYDESTKKVTITSKDNTGYKSEGSVDANGKIEFTNTRP